MQTMPLVSVIIPVYNRKKVIGDAIDSCIKQTYKNIEADNQRYDRERLCQP